MTAERLLAAIVDSSDDAIVSKDLSGIITSWNKGAERIFGFPASEAVGKSIMLIIPHNLAAEERTILARLQNGERIDHFQTIRRRKDGSLVNVSLTISPVRDAAGQVVGASKIARDITSQKLAEEQLKSALEEREKLLAELQRSNRELSNFCHLVAHDLNSPVRTVRTLVGILIQKHQGDGDDDIRHMAIRATDQMQKLIRSLLSYAEAGRGDLRIDLVPAAELVRAAEVALLSEIRDLGATIHRGPLPVVEGDQSQLEQVFQNLIENALKYRRQNTPPVIEISGMAVEDGWQFAVSDNGQGIPLEYTETIFRPLKRLHGSEIPGTGLGLALCRTIIERHGGKIWVESSEGQGAKFQFTLP